MRGWGATIVVAVTMATPVAAADEAARQGIMQTLADSAAAWSAGDLDRFMTCYADDPATTYVGGGQLVIGYQGIRTMYANRFGGGSRAAMGTLTLDIERLRLLGDDVAYVVGRFHLRRAAADGGDVSGLTTLVFRRQAGRWLIIADHS